MSPGRDERETMCLRVMATGNVYPTTQDGGYLEERGGGFQSDDVMIIGSNGICIARDTSIDGVSVGRTAWAVGGGMVLRLC